MGVSGPWQWGTIASVTSGSPFATVGVYLDTASGQTGATVTTNIPFLIGYKPTVGDVVLIGRMSGSARTQRIVLGTLASFGQGFSQAGVVFTPEVNMSGVATGKILLGTSGGGFRDSGDTVDALVFDSNQLATLRNALKIPPSAGGTLAATSYGSVPVKIGETTPTGVNTTFTSIPGVFRHLVLEWQARSNLASAAFEQLIINYNGDGGTNYDAQRASVVGDPATYAANTVTIVQGAASQTAILGMYVPASTAPANFAGWGRMEIFNYSGTTFYKVAYANWAYETLSTEGHSSMYHSTSAITSIAVGLVSGGSFITGTLFTLRAYP